MRRLAPIFLAIAVCLPAQTPPTLENDQASVILANQQPHVKTALHEHKWNRVMVYLSAGEQEIVSQDGKTTTVKFKAGEVGWSPVSGMHTSEVISSAPVKMIEVEVKKPGNPSKTASGPLDPVKRSPKAYTVEFENGQVRVLRVKLGPHESLPLHEHILNRAVIYLTDEHCRIVAADGKPDEGRHKPGDVIWAGPAKHTEANLLDTPVEAIVVEFKS
jgi:hypothetical protein